MFDELIIYIPASVKMNEEHEVSDETQGMNYAHYLKLLAGLQPAYQNSRTGESHLSQIEQGIPALVYGFAGLPEDWIVERDSAGNPVALHPDVVAGYWRDARFVKLSDLACMPLDA